MGRITFIIGGARSGKSGHALKLAGGAKRVAFVATCEALDNEMAMRIKDHKNDRPKHWTTFEEPLAVSALIRRIPAAHDLILIDCLTLLVSNLFLKKRAPQKIEKEIIAIMEELKKRKDSSIVVSNEVGLGIVPDNRLGREFRDVAGRVNKIAAERSAQVLFMVSGIPWRIK